MLTKLLPLTLTFLFFLNTQAVNYRNQDILNAYTPKHTINSPSAAFLTVRQNSTDTTTPTNATNTTISTNTTTNTSYTDSLEANRTKISQVYFSDLKIKELFNLEFAAADENDSGTISKPEFHVLIKAIYPKIEIEAPEDEALNRIFSEADKDMNGELSKDEALDAFKNVLLLSFQRIDDDILEDRIRTKWDISKYSLEDLKERKVRLVELEQDNNIFDETIEIILNLYDKDRDGNLDLKEFKLGFRFVDDMMNLGHPSEETLEVMYKAFNANKDYFVDREELLAGLRKMEKIYLKVYEEKIVEMEAKEKEDAINARFGQLNIEEIKVISERLGHFLENDTSIDNTTNITFAAIDERGWGDIDYDEYVTGLERIFDELGSIKPLGDEERGMFNIVDSDEDGFIDRGQFRQTVVQAVTSVKAIMDEKIKKEEEKQGTEKKEREEKDLLSEINEGISQTAK